MKQKTRFINSENISYWYVRQWRCLSQSCLTEIAYWDKNYVAILTRDAILNGLHW